MQQKSAAHAAEWKAHLKWARMPIAFALAVQIFELLFLPIASEASALDAAVRGKGTEFGRIGMAAAPVALAIGWPVICLVRLSVPLKWIARPPPRTLSTVSAALAVGAAALSLVTVETLRRCVSTGELCCGGVFTFSRNPINVCIMAGACAAAVLVPTLPNAAGTLLLGWHLNSQTSVEEASLESRFGRSWQQYAHTHTHTRTRMHARRRVGTHARTHARTPHTHTRAADSSAHAHTRTHVHTRAYTHAHAATCMHGMHAYTQVLLRRGPMGQCMGWHGGRRSCGLSLDDCHVW